MQIIIQCVYGTIRFRLCVKNVQLRTNSVRDVVPHVAIVIRSSPTRMTQTRCWFGLMVTGVEML